MAAERQGGHNVFSLFDRLPEHTVMVLTLTQELTRNHIAQVKRAAVRDFAEIALTREAAEIEERATAGGNKLYSPFQKRASYDRARRRWPAYASNSK